MKAKAMIKNGKLVIEVPLELLKTAIESHPEHLGVKDRAKMAMYFKKQVLEYSDPYNYGNGGLPDFFTLLDNIALDAYEGGEDWIKGLNEPDYRE